MKNTTADKIVVLARGLGTRMRRTDGEAALDNKQAAVADTGVKALIPIDRPFLDYVLSAAADAGFRRVCLVIGPEHEAIRQLLRRGSRRPTAELSLRLPAGAARARPTPWPPPRRSPAAIRSSVINSDNYYPVEALRALREQSGCAVALFEREAMLAGSNMPEERIKRFAVAKIDGRGCLEQIIEKPDDSHAGRLAQAALAEHELLAVRAVDLPGVPGDQAVAARRVRNPRRRAVRHQRHSARRSTP